MKKNVIDRKNLPMHWPVNITLIAALLIKVYDVPDFWCGIILTVMVILWLAVGYSIFTSKQVDIFEKEGPT